MRFYVSQNGDDRWSGKLARPNRGGLNGPFRTVAGARDALRALNKKGRLAGQVTVLLSGGSHPLRAPLEFGLEDSFPVTYAAAPGAQAVLDGGLRLTGFRKTKVGKMTAWVAAAPVLPGRAWYFRQLFVNGERRTRARLPAQGFYRMASVPGRTPTGDLFDGADNFIAQPGAFRRFRNLADAEVVALHLWTEERMPVRGYDPKSRRVTCSRPSMLRLHDSADRWARYYVDNVCEGLRNPGDWYFDRPAGKLYYLPLPGETIGRTEIVAPLLTDLLRLTGSPEEGRYVEGLRFENLAFQHADWVQPAGGRAALGRPDDLTDYASGGQAAWNVPGAIRLRGARNCALENCAVRQVGYYGIELADGCFNNRIVGCSISDLGAGGLKLNGAAACGPASCRNGNNRITDNHIHEGGRVFPSACGILAMHSFGNTIAHNHIHHFFYSGVSVGWVWGFGDSVARDNRIEKNHIHHLGNGILSDMGGIYTLGVQPGGIIRGNVIHDVEKADYGGWGIYQDEGSSHLAIENNLCYDCSSDPYNHHYGHENILRNNIFAFGGDGVVGVGRASRESAFTFERNILVSRDRPFFRDVYGAPLAATIFTSDLNLFWNAGQGEALLGKDAWRNNEYRLFRRPDWEAAGRDRHSVHADPLFKDLAHRDFTLAKNSPALALGFKPLDLGAVGPRPPGKRE